MTTTDTTVGPELELGAMWARVELLGHRTIYARVTETTLAGAGFLLLEIPGPDGTITATQYVAPSSIYCLTPITRDQVLAAHRPWRTEALETGDDGYDVDDNDDPPETGRALYTRPDDRFED